MPKAGLEVSSPYVKPHFSQARCKLPHQYLQADAPRGTCFLLAFVHVRNQQGSAAGEGDEQRPHDRRNTDQSYTMS